MRKDIKSSVAIAIATFCLVATGPMATAASSGDGTEVDDSYGMIEASVVDGLVDARASTRAEDSPIPADFHEALWRLGYRQVLADVNAIEWDDTKKHLTFHYKGDEHLLARLIGEELPGDAFTISAAVHSKAEIDALMNRILLSGGKLDDRTRIVSAKPAADGSIVTIGVNGDVSSAKKLFSENYPAVRVPIVFDESDDILPATRNVDTSFFRVGGALMTTSVTQGTKSCSTGFAIGSFTVSGARGLISADHCGAGTSNVWRYSNNTTSSTHMSPYQGMLTIAPGTPVDLGLWYDPVGTANFFPYIFTGDYLDTGTLSAIRGSVQPVIGDKVCYSGSRSGRVCDNTVIATGFLVCYSISQCYAATTVTTHDASVEAAGSGDSGGPVYASVDGKVYAAGIISGIIGGSNTCTGDPGATGGRQCSPTAIYEPHVFGLGPATTGWGLLVIP